MEEVQFEDFSVMEEIEIELDEHGDEVNTMDVNRILTENIHPYDHSPHIDNGSQDVAQLEGLFVLLFCVAFIKHCFLRNRFWRWFDDFN